MTWVHYQSLKPGAKAAIKRGPGTYRKYAVAIVDGRTYVAAVRDGRALEWIAVIKGSGPIIKAVTE